MAAVHYFTAKNFQNYPSLQIEASDRTTVGQMKAAIVEKTGLRADHIVMRVYRPALERFGQGITVSPGEDDFLAPLMKLEGINPQARSCTLSYEVIKCADESHCPKVLTIVGLAGPILSMSFTGETTFGQMKEKVAAEKGIPADQQRLIYKGKQVADGDAIGNEAEDGARVCLVLKLKV